MYMIKNKERQHFIGIKGGITRLVNALMWAKSWKKIKSERKINKKETKNWWDNSENLSLNVFNASSHENSQTYKLHFDLLPFPSL